MSEYKYLTEFVEKLVIDSYGVVYPVDGNCSRAPTEEGFVILTNYGVIKEGENKKGDIKFIDAVRNYKKVVMEYLDIYPFEVSTNKFVYLKSNNILSPPKVLYWRIKPQVSIINDFSIGKFIIYSRLLYSDNGLCDYLKIKDIYKEG